MKNLSSGLCCVTLTFLTLMLGCSNGHVSLQGRVTYSDNDEPLETGTVCLVSPTRIAQGIIEKEGHYVVGSFKAHDGLPPGDYQVFVVGSERLIDPENPNSAVPLIDPKFARAKTSDIVLTVDAKTKNFDFQVDRAKNEHVLQRQRGQ